MRRTLFSLPFMLLSALLMSMPAQAEDVMPPPTEVQDSPEARETVAPPPAPEASVSGELAGTADEGDANAEIHSSVREDGTKVDEYAHHGRVYMVKVTPPHGAPPYYLYDNNGDGTFERRLPGGYKHPSPPEWVIKRF